MRGVHERRRSRRHLAPQGRGGDDLVGTFVTLMLMALEYEAFADVMRDREKRRYFFAVLARWRDAL